MNRVRFTLIISVILSLLVISPGLYAAPAQIGDPLVTVEADEIPWDFPQADRVVAIGDIHGDFNALMTILLKMKLVDSDGTWTGKNSLLVFIGDLNDRGGDTRMVFDLIMNLEKQAKVSGGEVQTLLGNHELLVTEKDYRYVALREAKFFGTPTSTHEEAMGALKQAFQGDSAYAKWMRQRNTMVRVGRTLFVHGGVEGWAATENPARINATVRAWFTNKQGYAEAPPAESHWVIDEAGPLWSRKAALGKLDEVTFDQILKALDVDRVVVGHTTKNGPIRTGYGGKLFLIDSGISASYLGELSALEIKGKKTVPHVFERPDDNHPLIRKYREAWRNGVTFQFPKTQPKGISGCLRKALNYLQKIYE